MNHPSSRVRRPGKLQASTASAGPVDGAAPTADTRRGIQSIEVGGRLLNALSRHGAPMMLRDLAQAAGMVAASAHPYLVSFCKLGLVAQDNTSGRYQLGPFALELGLASLRQRDEIGLANAAAAELARATGLSVAVAVWGSFGATVVRLEAADQPLHVSLRAGSVMSLAGTATGRVFATWLPERIVLAVDEQTSRTVGADDSGTPPGADADVNAIRSRGMARAVGSPIPGINAFSAPVFDQHGELVLVLTLLGSTRTLPEDWHGDGARALEQAATALSRRLGHTGCAI